MSKRPTDEEIRGMVRDLPRREPPPGFARKVMNRVHAEHARRRFRPWLLAAAAAVAGLALTLLLSSGRHGFAPGSGDGGQLAETDPSTEFQRAPLDSERREFEAIREEYRQLAAEIEVMRRFAGDPPVGPLVRIVGSDELELFFDLQSYLDLPPRPAATSTVVPASDRGRR